MARVDREGPIHKAIVDYLRAVLPGSIVHYCKNEINKSGMAFAVELAKARRKGAVTGFPDIIALTSSGALFFEVKAPAGYPTKTQKEVHAKLQGLGYRVAVVRSIDDVSEKLKEWSVI